MNHSQFTNQLPTLEQSAKRCARKTFAVLVFDAVPVRDFDRLATYCLANEKRMRRISGYQDLPALWIRLRTLVAEEKNVDSNEAVA